VDFLFYDEQGVLLDLERRKGFRGDCLSELHLYGEQFPLDQGIASSILLLQVDVQGHIQEHPRKDDLFV